MRRNTQWKWHYEDDNVDGDGNNNKMMNLIFNNGNFRNLNVFFTLCCRRIICINRVKSLPDQNHTNTYTPAREWFRHSACLRLSSIDHRFNSCIISLSLLFHISLDTTRATFIIIYYIFVANPLLLLRCKQWVNDVHAEIVAAHCHGK